MKVITLSKRFPAYHPRKGDQTGFLGAYLAGRKLHTIRKNRKEYFKDGDKVSVRQWSERPYASKQEIVEDGRKIGIEPVLLDYCEQAAVHPRRIPFSELAENDGLSVKDFNDWFFPEGNRLNTVDADIVHFTDFRYAGGADA